MIAYRFNMNKSVQFSTGFSSQPNVPGVIPSARALVDENEGEPNFELI